MYIVQISVLERFHSVARVGPFWTAGEWRGRRTLNMPQSNNHRAGELGVVIIVAGTLVDKRADETHLFLWRINLILT